MSTMPAATALDFELPSELEAHDPPEAFGRARDDVRMMVAFHHDLRLVHARFRDLPSFLWPGDLVVVNDSRTLPASLPVTRADGRRLDLHLSTPVDGEVWVVEARMPSDEGGRAYRELTPGETLALPDGAADVLGPYPPICRPRSDWPSDSRLWTAALHLPSSTRDYLERHGHPIRYGAVVREWPASYYQTVYAADAGSVEMPSAGRAFTPERIARLRERGIEIATITLHAGVSSLEDHEPPLTEFYRVSEETADAVARTRRRGGRVVAIGTTVVRALETVSTADRGVRADQGWTRMVITPARGVRVVDALLTGWHEPRASHLLMLEAVAGRKILEISYRAALQMGYRWHEFGDLHLLLP